MRFSIDSLILVIVIFGLSLLLIIPIWKVLYGIYHPCIHTHVEQQIENPPAVVVGGSKYGGGIAMPLGNGRIVNVEVCDKNK